MFPIVSTLGEEQKALTRKAMENLIKDIRYPALRVKRICPEQGVLGNTPPKLTSNTTRDVCHYSAVYVSLFAIFKHVRRTFWLRRASLAAFPVL